MVVAEEGVGAAHAGVVFEDVVSVQVVTARSIMLAVLLPSIVSAGGKEEERCLQSEECSVWFWVCNDGLVPHQ